MKKSKPPAGVLIGYARVSTREQNLDMQLDALRAAGVEEHNIHIEKVSGAARKRPALTASLLDARPGDTLVVWKLDRLGRETLKTLLFLDGLTRRGIGFKSLTEQIDTTTPNGRFMLTMLAGFAELERGNTILRTKAAIAAHIKRGGRVGRRQVLSEAQKKQARAWRAEGMSVPDIAKRLGVSKQTVYQRALRKRR